MSSTLCNLFTPFQYRVGVGHGFDDFQKTTFGTLKTIPVDGVELTRLMMAMQSIEKKFDCDMNKFFKTPEKWIKLEQKLRKIYYADNQDSAGYEGFLQHHMKNRAQRKVFESIDLQLRDVVNVDEYDDKLTLREFVECIGIQELRDPMNFVSRADLREPPYLHYKTDPAKDKYPRNTSVGTGRDAHSPSPDQIEIILLLMRRSYSSNRPQEFTQNINKKTKVSTLDTKNKMKAFIAQLQSSSAASFISVSGESCRIDMMKLPETKDWLRTMYYTRMGDLKGGNISLAQKMEMRKQIVKSFRGGFDNLAVPEVGLKIMKAMFPERTANPDPKNSGNSNIHVPSPAVNSMTLSPQNSTRPLMMGNSSSRNFDGVGSQFADASGLPAHASSHTSTWVPSNLQWSGNHTGSLNDNGLHAPGSPTHATPHSSYSAPSNHQWNGIHHSGGSDGVGNPFSGLPELPAHASSHTSSTWVPSNLQWSGNHTGRLNDNGLYAPGSPAHATPRSSYSAPSSHQWNGNYHSGGLDDVGSPFTGIPGLPAHASPHTSTWNTTDQMSGNCIPASTNDADYAHAVAFHKSGAWSPTNLFVMQPDPEWDRIHREFNIPM
ncbi:hypothetical protein CAEBREN_04582 [Caenorhabditis brenneri]|uniref:Uncharacterized protein n=1 Tax=Caenorhabditis brenneri TaxID=135651 RepID=G0MQW7_CAEBE|nr:hypothetical protein CAEBREN_04582 [Caenorhabditis brenneri]